MSIPLKGIDCEDLVRNTTMILGAGLTAWALHARGWPWFSWLPAAVLMAVLVAGLWVVVWYIRRKLTYPRRARAMKAHLGNVAQDRDEGPPPTP